METDNQQRVTPDRKIALLIDADNVSHGKIAAILAELSKYGTANIRRAYGNWTSASLKGWKDKLHDFAIRPIQQFDYSTGKNATDIALVIDAMELLYTQKLDAFCLASSDADFTPLVMQLRANGHEVYGFGERKTPVAKAKAAPAKAAGKSLAMDTKLVTILRGSAAKRQAPIDPRNYGAKNFPALFAATGLFDIVKVDNGHSYVADKRNKDRAAEPTQ